jgi:hypothetical protein
MQLDRPVRRHRRWMSMTWAWLFTTLAGCMMTPPGADFHLHALTIDRHGDILAPRPPGQPADSYSELGKWFTEIDVTELPSREKDSDRYIDDLFSGVPERIADYGNLARKRTGGEARELGILIFVHGGLNSLASSTCRVNEIIEAYKRHELRDHSLDPPGSNTYYPVLVNWDSGLWESYFDHLFLVRQGEARRGIALATWPFYLAADAGRAAVRAPIAMGTAGYRLSESMGGPVVRSQENAERLYQGIRNEQPRNVSSGIAGSGSPDSLAVQTRNLLTIPFQLATAPIIDGFGTPAWEGMQRHSKALFNLPVEFDVGALNDKDPVGLALQGMPHAAMHRFHERLRDLLRASCIPAAPLADGTPRCHQRRLTIVAHSMGAFIVNEFLRRYRDDILVDDIVYMAGADSVRNTLDSVVPYLAQHPCERGAGKHCPRFFNLSLHPRNEVSESNYFGLIPRGSLLVWIDDFFSSPLTQYDRTVGRWENVIQAYGEFPKELRDRVFLKAFNRDSRIAKHGDFSRARFWEETFWQPGGAEGNPWPPVQGRDGDTAGPGSERMGFYYEQGGALDFSCPAELPLPDGAITGR